MWKCVVSELFCLKNMSQQNFRNLETKMLNDCINHLNCSRPYSCMNLNRSVTAQKSANDAKSLNRTSLLFHERRECTTQAMRRLDEAKQMQTYKYASKQRSKHSNVHVCGLSYTGALGVPKFVITKKTSRRTRQKFVTMPYKLQMDCKITSAACGYGFTLLASSHTESTKVWGTGVNTDSQIGFQPRNHSSESGLVYLLSPAPLSLPLMTSSLTRVTQVSCGRAHSLILTDKEGVFSIGNNASGQCGRSIIDNEEYSSSRVVHKIPGLDGTVTQVVCGHDHSLFLTDAGHIYSCGWGADGQTGLGHNSTVSTPTRIQGDLKGEKIVEVATFSDCCLARSEKGDVFGWGNSEYNQLGAVTEETQVCEPRYLPFQSCGKITSVAAGGTICAIVNDEGEVFTWGYGILGKGPKLADSTHPQHIPSVLFGRTELNPDVKVSKVRCGLHHFAAVTDVGDLFTWGANGSGCLGLSSLSPQFFPLRVCVPGEVTDVACGVDHTAILSKNLM